MTVSDGLAFNALIILVAFMWALFLTLFVIAFILNRLDRIAGELKKHNEREDRRDKGEILMGNELEARERVFLLEAAFADEKAFAATLQTQITNAQRLFKEMEAERDAAKAEIVRLTAERDRYQQEVINRENELESLRLQVVDLAHEPEGCE